LINYSINLNNINFEKYPENTNLKINNVNMSNYLIIKIKCKLNYKSFLTISSAFYETEPFIQIYSYKLIYLSKGKEINFKLDNKAQQYKLKIINNMNQKDKGEIRFKKDNVIKDNINNNYGKQISYPINKGINNLEFLCKNNSNITQFIKFDYKRQRKNVEEINYGATRKPIFKSNEFPVIFYIKNINDKGLDFNILLEGKIEKLNILFFF